MDLKLYTYLHTQTHTSTDHINCKHGFALTDAQQLAIETMFQDEMLPPQTMPWWDPGYLANSDVSS